MSLQILYEDNHIIAINKSSSDLVQGDYTGDISLDMRLKEYIKETYGKPGNVYLGVVHRIDRPVSGIVLFARTSKALSRLNKMFRDQQIRKKYWAIVKNIPDPDSGELTHFLIRNTKLNKSFVYDHEIQGAKLARMAYRRLVSSKPYHLLEIDLFTGRHHQIRCQLSKINCPVKGDLKYGFPVSNPDAGISLHAREVRFNHPVRNEEVTLVAPPPEEASWKMFMTLLKKKNLLP